MTVLALASHDRLELAELVLAVERLHRAATLNDGLLALDALGDVDELWAHLRPAVALREGASVAAVVDDAVAGLHLAPDPLARRRAASEVLVVLAQLSADAVREAHPLGLAAA